MKDSVLTALTTFVLFASIALVVIGNTLSDQPPEPVEEKVTKEVETYEYYNRTIDRDSDWSRSNYGPCRITERQDEVATTEEIEFIDIPETFVEVSSGAWDLFYTPWGSVFEEITPEQFKDYGEFRWHDWRYTWYSEKVLPGGGLDIPGRWSDTYFVRDENNYICVACTDLSYGSIVETPWGLGKVYDTGNAHYSIDVYVTW